MRCCSTDCRIPLDAILGSENQGFKIAVGELAGGRIGVGSFALGIGLAAMDYARQYITERQQFGQALSNFQGLQWILADRYTELEAVRLLLMQAASLKEQGLSYSETGLHGQVVCHGKGQCRLLLRIADARWHGYSAEYPLERWSRDARITSICEGTSEIQRIIIARELLLEIV